MHTSPLASHLQNIPAYVPGRAVEDVRRELGLRHVIRLASNESPFGPTPLVRLAVTAAAMDLAHYADERASGLRGKIAAHLGVSADEVVVLNGSGEAIELLARAVAAPGAEALMPERSFMAYEIASRAAGLRVRTAPLRGWRADVDALLAELRPETRVVFLANPGNPTGTFLAEAELGRLLRCLPHHVLVVVDEAYHEYASMEGCPDATRLRDLHPNLVILRTFSKAYGLAALRVGYAVAPAFIASALDRLRTPFNTSRVAQAAASAALDDVSGLERAVAHNGRARRILVEELRKLGIEVVDSATNFLLLPLGRPAAPVAAGLLRRGVLVRTLEPYGLPDAIRVTVGMDDENAAFLAALAEVLDELPPDHAADRLARIFRRAVAAREGRDSRDVGNLYALGAGPDEMLAAYEVLSRRTPFIRFGYVASNLAILRAVAGERVVQVLDVGIGWGGQWLDLIGRLGARPGGPPELAITGVEIPTPGADPQAQLRAVGARLSEAAARAGVPFRFQGLASPIERLREIPRVPGAALIVNAAFALHHVADGSVATDLPGRDEILAALAGLRPRLFTLVEPEADHNAPAFPERLSAALHHYGAVFSALERLCGDRPRERRTIEEAFFGREILNVVASEGADRVERHEPLVAWRRRLDAAGLRGDGGVELLDEIVAQLPLPEGATLVAEQGAVQLCWMGVPVVNALAVAPSSAP